MIIKLAEGSLKTKFGEYHEILFYRSVADSIDEKLAFAWVKDLLGLADLSRQENHYRTTPVSKKVIVAFSVSISASIPIGRVNWSRI